MNAILRRGTLAALMTLALLPATGMAAHAEACSELIQVSPTMDHETDFDHGTPIAGATVAFLPGKQGAGFRYDALDGHVVGTPRKPVATTTTRADGSVCVSPEQIGLAPGTYQLLFSKPGYVSGGSGGQFIQQLGDPQTFNGTDGVSFMGGWMPHATVSTWIKNYPAKKRIPGSSVQFYAASNSRTPVLTVVPDARGEVHVDALAHHLIGRFKIRYVAPGYATLWHGGQDFAHARVFTLGVAEVDAMAYGGTFLLPGKPVIKVTRALKASRKPAVGKKVRVSFKAAKGATASYRWKLDGKPIKRATSASYRPTRRQRHHVLSVAVTLRLKGHANRVLRLSLGAVR